MTTYTTSDGYTVEFTEPAAESPEGALLARVRAALADPSVTADDMITMVYGPTSPIMNHDIIPGWGFVDKEVHDNPLYKLMSSMINQKHAQAPAGPSDGGGGPERFTLDLEGAHEATRMSRKDLAQAARERRLGSLRKDAEWWFDPVEVRQFVARFTVGVSEASEALGNTPAAIRKACRQRRLSAIRIANRWMMDPASVEKFVPSRTGKRLPEPPRAPEPALPADPTARSETFLPAGRPVTFSTGKAGGQGFQIRHNGTAEGDTITGWSVIVARWFDSNRNRHRFFEIVPAKDEEPTEPLTFGDFHLSGQVRIVRKVNNARLADAAWKTSKKFADLKLYREWRIPALKAEGAFVRGTVRDADERYERCEEIALELLSWEMLG